MGVIHPNSLLTLRPSPSWELLILQTSCASKQLFSLMPDFNICAGHANLDAKAAWCQTPTAGAGATAVRFGGVWWPGPRIFVDIHIQNPRYQLTSHRNIWNILSTFEMKIVPKRNIFRKKLTYWLDLSDLLQRNKPVTLHLLVEFK